MSLFDTLSQILQDGPFSLPTNGATLDLGTPVTLPKSLSGNVSMGGGVIHVTLDQPVHTVIEKLRTKMGIDVTRITFEPGDVLAASWGPFTKRFKLTEME